MTPDPSCHARSPETIGGGKLIRMEMKLSCRRFQLSVIILEGQELLAVVPKYHFHVQSPAVKLLLDTQAVENTLNIRIHHLKIF